MELAHDVVVAPNGSTLVANSDTAALVSSYNGVAVGPLQQYTWKSEGPSQINPCRIGNHQFLLSSVVMSSKECSYFLTPDDKQTTADTLRAGSVVTTYAMNNLRGKYANVFFIGQNGGFSDVADLIRQLSAMIAYSQSNAGL